MISIVSILNLASWFCCLTSPSQVIYLGPPLKDLPWLAEAVALWGFSYGQGYR